MLSSKGLERQDRELNVKLQCNLSNLITRVRKPKMLVCTIVSSSQF